MNIPNEFFIRAKNAKSVDELVGLARAEGVEMSRAELESRFNDWHCEGELSDEELENAAGGGNPDCGSAEDPNAPPPVPKYKDDLCEHFEERCGGGGGDHLKFYTGFHCESCDYFYTNPNSFLNDANYNGNGYCVYDQRTYYYTKNG